MKKILTLESLGIFLLSIFLFSKLDYAWWVFPALLLLPDLSMLGYLINPKIGAYLYNFFHHKLVGILVYLVGIYFDSEMVQLIGIILLGHSAMDRIFGYGLKYTTSFQDTHLGKIGKEKSS